MDKDKLRSNRNKIIVTGLSGLVGSRIQELLKHKYAFESLSRSKGIDIIDRDQVMEKILASEGKIVLHLAAKTNVDECEQDRDEGVGGDAWYTNVYATQSIADACQQSGKKLIYISTDMVFGGNDTPDGGYTEESKPHPHNWYGLTKWEGEKVVRAMHTPWMIVRISYPYRAKFERKDFVRTLLGLLQAGREIKAITDHRYNPTFIDDIAYAIDALIDKDETGIFHVTGSESITPFEAARKIATVWGLDTSLVKETNRHEFFKDRAPRPFDLSMNNDKIQKLGISMKTFSEGLEILKEQIAKQA